MPNPRDNSWEFMEVASGSTQILWPCRNPWNCLKRSLQATVDEASSPAFKGRDVVSVVIAQCSVRLQYSFLASRTLPLLPISFRAYPEAGWSQRFLPWCAPTLKALSFHAARLWAASHWTRSTASEHSSRRAMDVGRLHVVSGRDSCELKVRWH